MDSNDLRAKRQIPKDDDYIQQHAKRRQMHFSDIPEEEIDVITKSVRLLRTWQMILGGSIDKGMGSLSGLYRKSIDVA